MPRKFTQLATHSDYSLFKGAASQKKMIEAAAERGDTAIAFTELGSLRGLYTQQKSCDKAGIKPIYGVEVFFCRDASKKGIPKDIKLQIREGLNPHEYADAEKEYAIEHGYMVHESELSTLNLWALNDKGLRNLYKLTSKSWTDGFYYQPRVDIDMLRLYNGGIVCGTGGIDSAVMRPMLAGKRKDSIEFLEQLKAIYGDRLYLEVRPHKLMKQAKANKFAEQQSKKLSIELLATVDAHYVAEGDLQDQKMVHAIGNKSKPSEIENVGLPIDSFWMRTGDETFDGLINSKVSEDAAERAIENAATLGDECNARVEFDPFAMIIPNIDTGDLTHAEYLRKLVDESPKLAAYKLTLLPEEMAKYQKRIEHELTQLENKVSENSDVRFTSYIVYVYEVLVMCRELGIAIGPGRGSAAGSIVNHLIDITDVDPIEHGLLFSRFIAPNRIGPPDIDIDIDPDGREALLAAMRERWGADCVAQIATFGKFKGRLVTNDICRKLGISPVEIRPVTKKIELRSDHDKRPFSAVRDAFLGYTDGDGLHHTPSKECVEFNEKHPKVLQYASKLEGNVRLLGTHPAGIVCSPQPLVNYIPLETRAGKNGQRVVITAFDMQGVEQCGLLKIDMLGLINVKVIDAALKSIGNPSLNTYTIPLDDEATLQAFSDRDFAGVFQYDSNNAKKLCGGVTFPTFSVIADMTALNRPGPLDSGMAMSYIERKAGGEVEIDYSKKASEILDVTFGVMVYQEQIMEICGEIGQHPNPDKMRKIIGKKLVDQMAAEKPGIIKGALETCEDMSEEQAEKLWSDIEKAGKYSFNKSHSVAYAKIGYHCQYLKTHYPLEFFWSLITNSKSCRRRHYAREAASRDIAVLPPSVQVSSFTLGMDKSNNAIVGGLTDINGVGVNAAKQIVETQPFADFQDFMDRAACQVDLEDGSKRVMVNTGAIKSLAQAGALDDLIPNLKAFLDSADEMFRKSKHKRGWPGWETALKWLPTDSYSKEEKMLLAAEINPMALGNPYSDMLNTFGVEFEPHGDADFFIECHDEPVWITGTISDLVFYPNEPFGGREMTEKEKKHEGAGEEYAVFNLDDDGGGSVRVKVDWDVTRDQRVSIEDDTAVIILGIPNAEYNNVRAKIILPLEKMRTNQIKGHFVDIARGKHPARQRQYGKKHADAMAYRANYRKMQAAMFNDEFQCMDIMGVVTSVRTSITKKGEGEEMAWVGLATPDGYHITVTFFSSSWLGTSRWGKKKPPFKGAFKSGDFINIEVEAGKPYNGKRSCEFKGYGFEMNPGVLKQ